MTFKAEPAVQMLDEEFRLLRALIREHCGISFPDDNKYLVERRLAPRLEALRLANFTDYYRHLRYAADQRAEMEEIVERVTTNETYFFRERYQLDAFQKEILPEIAARKRRSRRLHVWSAGCSTGEEAYTIAMLILESGLFSGCDVRVFGTDISRRVVAAARKGVYGRSSFRTTEERYTQGYFEPAAEPGKLQVKPVVRALVNFGLVNLFEDEMLPLVGEMDVVLCRNVLIYFDVDARKRVIQSFHKRLLKGGYLLLGHTESLLNLSTDFELIHLKNDMVYRKP